MRLILLLAAIAILPASAASEKSITLRTLALGNVNLPEAFLHGPKGFVPVKFSTIQPSQPTRVRLSNPLPIFTRALAPDEDEAAAKPAVVKLPSNAKAILLLAWKSGTSTHYSAIADNFGSARAGDWMLINTTNLPVAFQVGKDTKPLQIKAGKSAIHRISAKQNRGAAVTAAAPAGKEWKKFFSTYWPVYSDKRCLVLFVADGDRILVKRIADKLVTKGKDAS